MAASHEKLSRRLLAGMALFGVVAWLFVTVFAPQYNPVLIAVIFLLLLVGVLGSAVIRKLRGKNG